MSPPGRTPGRTVRDLGLVLLCCALVYWPRLGVTGLSASEGHRAIPAWEMLRGTETWLVPTLFGQPYLNKPPGVVWAIAASSFLFGETEFAARAVSALSATIASLAAFVFAGRWFGWRWAIWAGLAQALTPQNWWFGRAAEIEALNNASVQVAVLCLIDSTLARGRWGVTAVGVLAATSMWLAKGPAALPILLAAAMAALAHDRRGMLRASAIILLSAAAFGVLALIARESAEGSVRQGVGDFLWSDVSPRGAAEIVALGPTAWLLALPGSLALLPFLRTRAPDNSRDTRAPEARRVAKALAGTCIMGLVLLALLGVRNPRYALPAMVTIPVLVAFVAASHRGAEPARRPFSRLASPRWLFLLIPGAAIFILYHEPNLRRSSGRSPGLALGEHLEDGSEVWADHLIAARPETVEYARRRAAELGRDVRIRWVPGLAGRLPDPGGFLVLRRDGTTDEEQPYRSAGLWQRLSPIHSGRVHEFEFTLYRVSGAGTPP